MLEIGARVGHYEVLKPLDKGGMGRVYLVRHVTLDAQYAMKVLNPEVAENEEYVARFLREGRLASKLHHPNLITVHDAGQDAVTGLNYLIMDYIPGGTLADLLKKEKRVSPERALSIVRQVARALAAAAERGMVHRDIKPANIMFDRDGTVRVADLGIAKGGDDMTAVTCSEAVFGTPAYMSPEQAMDSGRVDGRTDIYSLGVVLWQMLAGERPYADKTAMGIVASLLSPAPLRDIRAVNPNTPAEIARLISDMCQKDVSRRIPSAKALLARLDGLLDGADDATAMTVAFTPPGTSAATAAPRRPSVWARPVVWGTASVAVIVAAVVAFFAATSSKSPYREAQPADAVPETIVVTNEAVTSTNEAASRGGIPAAPQPPPKVSEDSHIATNEAVSRGGIPAAPQPPPEVSEDSHIATNEAASRGGIPAAPQPPPEVSEDSHIATNEAVSRGGIPAAPEPPPEVSEDSHIATNEAVSRGGIPAAPQPPPEAERLEKERKRLEAERAEAERKRLDAEAMLAAAAMSGFRAEAKPNATKSEPPKTAIPTVKRPKRDPAALALAAFAVGNWSLGYQYALQDATGNAEVELWLGRCFDPSVKMPGFERHKKDADLARKHYRRAAEKGNADAQRALRGL